MDLDTHSAGRPPRRAVTRAEGVTVVDRRGRHLDHTLDGT